LRGAWEVMRQLHSEDEDLNVLLLNCKWLAMAQNFSLSAVLNSIFVSNTQLASLLVASFLRPRGFTGGNG